MKLVVTDGATLSGGGVSLDGFRRFGELVVYDLTAPEQLAERVGDADAVLCNKTPIPRSCLTSVRTCAMWASAPQGITTLILLRRRRTA